MKTFVTYHHLWVTCYMKRSSQGVAYQKHEVSLAVDKRLLEVNTYQIFDEQRRIAGSALSLR